VQAIQNRKLFQSSSSLFFPLSFFKEGKKCLACTACLANPYGCALSVAVQ
jgi:hypothetical protein